MELELGFDSGRSIKLKLKHELTDEYLKYLDNFTMFLFVNIPKVRELMMFSNLARWNLGNKSDKYKLVNTISCLTCTL